jgi:hypothetical protein
MSATDNVSFHKTQVNDGNPHTNAELGSIHNKLVDDSIGAQIGRAIGEQGKGVAHGVENQLRVVQGNEVKSDAAFAKEDQAKAMQTDHSGMKAKEENDQRAAAFFSKPIEAPEAYAKAEQNTFKHVDNPHQPEVINPHQQKAA